MRAATTRMADAGDAPEGGGGEIMKGEVGNQDVCACYVETRWDQVNLGALFPSLSRSRGWISGRVG